MADTFPELIHLERCDGEVVWIEGHPDSDEAETAVYVRSSIHGNTVRLLSEVGELTAERDLLLSETSNAGERVAQLEAEVSAAKDAEVQARAGRRASFEEAQRYRAERDEAQAELSRLSARLDMACRFINDMLDLIEQSGGVYGLHLNGDPSPWPELRRGGRFEDWLGSFDDALEALTGQQQEATDA